MQVHSRPATAGAGSSPDASRASAGLRRILFASDLSRAADVAFDHARHLADAFRAHLTVYHAVEVAPKPRGGPHDPRLEYWSRRERIAREALLRTVGPGAAGVEVAVDYRAKTSSPASSIPGSARSRSGRPSRRASRGS